MNAINESFLLQETCDKKPGQFVLSDEVDDWQLTQAKLYDLMEENSQLRKELEKARTTIRLKDDIILAWVAAAKAWKAVSTALREEGQAARNPQEHPLAYDGEQRSSIYRRIRDFEYARLKAMLFPPTTWWPK